MNPVLLQIVLSGEQAVALWSNVTWSGKATGPSATIQAIAQRTVEEEANKAIRFFESYPASRDENREKFEAAHPAIDPPPETEREALQRAAGQLAGSERGRAAAAMLHSFLTGDGGSLDVLNQRAVIALLTAAFGSMPGTVRELLEEAAAGVRVFHNGKDEQL